MALAMTSVATMRSPTWRVRRPVCQRPAISSSGAISVRRFCATIDTASSGVPCSVGCGAVAGPSCGAAVAAIAALSVTAAITAATVSVGWRATHAGHGDVDVEQPVAGRAGVMAGSRSR